MNTATRIRDASETSGSTVNPHDGAEEAVAAVIARRIERDISAMRDLLGDSGDREMFLTLLNWTRSSLDRIGALIAEGLIDPQGRPGSAFRTAGTGRRSRAQRIGVFPTAGNPLHWAHLLSGLAAMERFCLDKVVYVIAGEDPRKPDLPSSFMRHRIAKKVVDLFDPLFEYSPIAVGGAAPGEVNVFRILGLDRSRTQHAFYLAGSDHCNRFSPQSGRPDTIQMLEEGVRRRMYGFNPLSHELSVVFLDRGDHAEPVKTFLDVRWIDRLPLSTSSTRIRAALGSEEPLYELSALPFTAYCEIGAHGMYHASPSRRHMQRIEKAAERGLHRKEPGPGESP